LNILCTAVHESYQTLLSKTGHNFYLCWFEGMKRWNSKFRKLPENHHLLPDNTIGNISYDLILSGNKFDNFQRLKPIANLLHLGLISTEHTLPFPQWSKEQLNQLSNMRGDINVFISSFGKKEWLWDDKDNTCVINHGIESELFIPAKTIRKNTILTVVNDYIGRDWCCGYNLYKRITNGLSVTPVGDTKGFSLPAKDINDLINYYQTSRIFLSTATISPIPMSVLEAASSGCAIITTSNPLLAEVIINGKNGFISNDEKELRSYCELLLKDEALAKELGENARKTVIEKFSESKFIQSWDEVFRRASNIVYRG
jgi:hypothetical protein